MSGRQHGVTLRQLTGALHQGQDHHALHLRRGGLVLSSCPPQPAQEVTPYMALEQKNGHALHAQSVAKALDTHVHDGLTQAEAQRRLAERGPNELKEKPRPGMLQMLLDQFNNFLIIILIVAAVISLLWASIIDAARDHGHRRPERRPGRGPGVQGRGGAGRAQEDGRAQRPGDPRRLQRDVCPAASWCPATSCCWRPATTCPPTCAWSRASTCSIEEAALTGESVPVEKDAEVVLDEDAPLGDRAQLRLHEHHRHLRPRAGASSSATGMNTEIGKIAEMIQSYEEEATPLQHKLEQLGKTLGIGCPGHLRRGLRHRHRARSAAAIGLPAASTVRDVHDRRQPGHRRRARGPAGRRDHLPGPGHAADGPAPRPDPQAARRRDAGQRHGHLLRQDRHPDPERDDGRAACYVDGRRFEVDGRGLRAGWASSSGRRQQIEPDERPGA